MLVILLSRHHLHGRFVDCGFGVEEDSARFRSCFGTWSQSLQVCDLLFCSIVVCFESERIRCTLFNENNLVTKTKSNKDGEVRRGIRVWLRQMLGSTIQFFLELFESMCCCLFLGV